MTNKQYDNTIKIVQSLHATLDIEQILITFKQYLRTLLKFNGLQYQNNTLNEQHRFGKKGQNVYSFNLSVNDFCLGTIEIYKRAKFNDKELAILEEALCYLLQPLRNAIIHFQALHAAIHDPLTQLRNRSTLTETLQREIKLAERSHQPLSLLMIDIDNFKSINDTYGHTIGDTVLKALSDLIRQTMRETDIAFRMGGEEFLLLLNDTKPSGAKKLAERLRVQVEQRAHDHNLTAFTISIGLADFNLGDDSNTLINRADQALYQAKSSGKNQVSIAKAKLKEC